MPNLETLLRVPYIDPYNGFDLSPDGSRVAFSWNISGRWEIYEMLLPSPSPVFGRGARGEGLGEAGGPRRASAGHGGKFAPRYSPDDASLAWALDIDGSESFHIVLEDLLEGYSVDLDADTTCAIQPSFAWSPDSRQIAYLADKTGNFDLYLRNADGSNDRFVFSAGGPAVTVKWSPDGAYLAVTATMEGQNHGTFIVSADGTQSHRIGDADNPMDAANAAFSPDGKRVAFSSFASGWDQVGIYDLATRQVEWVTRGESNNYQPFWSPDGSRLGWINARGAAASLMVKDGSEEARQIQTGRGLIHMPKFSMDGASVIFIFESPLHPPDLWAVSLADGCSLAPPVTIVPEAKRSGRAGVTQLTQSLPKDVHPNEMVMPEEITYPSLDGTTVPALLYKPEGANAHSPGVVLIHGGPNWNISFLWYPVMTHMASRGWTVIAPNYRGSTGYGRDWQLANRFEIGHLDNDDCAASALYLARNGLADPTRIAVTGRSHGGYLTMTCLTRQPELWKAGSAVVPFLNWFTGHENSREDLQHWDIENMGKPEENQELWRERSPFFFLDKVRAPVQLICGENDPRCPPSESVEAHKIMKELGLQSELLLYKDEGHTFMKIENVVDSEVKRVEFLARVLEKV
jgi:dipeptidyl aminopeptidase/acylaminoacyl peptidase